MPLPVFVGCAVQYINNRTHQLLSKVPIVLEPLSNSPLLATITGSTYYAQLLHNISVVDATLFACRFTKLYRSYYPLPIPVIAKPVTAKDIAMKMLSTFIANGFMTRTFIALIILLTTLYFAIFIRR